MKEVSLKDGAFEEFSEAVDFGKIKLVKETTLKNIINHADLFKMFDKRIAIDKQTQECIKTICLAPMVL